MNAEENRIREFAYQIWESEGRPNGQDARHWEMARKLAAAEHQEAARPVVRNRKVTKPTEAALEPALETPDAAPAAARKPRAPRSSAAKTTSDVKEPKAAKASKVPKTPKTAKTTKSK